ncbi:hypothetical protein GCM10012290_16300 [Halolactibacillus alkaliphilus]|uniref:Uncharacterized protein n=1 Tax=Halolactibacillus alkaliphilus TaxID=442899 RepID=A0A511X1M4_9BACI|nr:hypothetical protein [Halolactibacillus alkaliphilus]GEN56856.1 hypothetical protein HAL01_13200 [Halolactibacillus alkaliphilus]GGN71430.1 hypothetical protein GCM10012290_16300 [Halolactibacillus alkaliphilus]SFO82235.1 hypothetical protein SAMN05720591_11423 [Halolactibacillus alkaliphilus]
MKVIVWVFVTLLLIWEIVELRGIFGYSLFTQNSLILLSSSYFFYLLDVAIDVKQIKRQLMIIFKNTMQD